MSLPNLGITISTMKLIKFVVKRRWAIKISFSEFSGSCYALKNELHYNSNARF